MFSGIITETGTVADVLPNAIRVGAHAAFVRNLVRGTSVSVDGACLTVVSKDISSFTTDIMPETKRRTTLGSLRVGETVNLELPVTASSFLSGHIVQGHVDGIGTLKHVKKDGDSHIFSITVPHTLARYIAPKGSVTVSGVALTVIAVRSSSFSAGIIPHTFRTTTMHRLAVRDSVNIEVDVLAKYVEKFTRKHSQ